MVFESLLREDNAEQHLLYVFFIGMLYASLGVIFDKWVFHGSIENLAIFITVMAALPLMYKIIYLEENKTRKSKQEKSLLKEHEKALKAFIALFVGMCIAFSFWNLMLPINEAKELFAAQYNDIGMGRSIINGNIVQPDVFPVLFANNIRVLVFSFLFSFFCGAGAIFILTWNAAILAVAIGIYVRQAMQYSASVVGGSVVLSFIGNFSYGFFGYMSHGIFEIASYFLAGLAGGIVSVAVIRHDLFDKNYKKVVVDALWLMGFAFLLLVIGAIIEVFISSSVF